MLNGFMLDRGRLAVPDEAFLAEDPVRLIEAFVLADAHGLEIHPLAMRAISRQAKLVDQSVRADPRANALFLDLLTSPRDPGDGAALDERGGRVRPLRSRFRPRRRADAVRHVPPLYGRRAHDPRDRAALADRARRAAEDHKLATGIIKRIASRRVLYVAVLLHDIAKGRGGDHSVLGAEIARDAVPALGLSPAETETVAWLVRWHLLMSSTAQKRDLSDPKTIQDFTDRVKSLERLRLLYLLTVVDIRAVGPGTWNSWKRPAARNLFEAAEEVLRLGHKQRAARAGRGGPGGARRAARLGRAASRASPGGCPTAIGWPSRRGAGAQCPLRRRGRPRARARPVAICVQEERGATLVTVYAKDQPGLFYRLAGGDQPAGGNIIDARIHTTATAWRSTISWSRTRPARRSAIRTSSSGSSRRCCARWRAGAADRAAGGQGAAAGARRGLHIAAGRVRR
jgi:[protein-PII] uridylyltransferase